MKLMGLQKQSQKQKSQKPAFYCSASRGRHIWLQKKLFWSLIAYRLGNSLIDGVTTNQTKDDPEAKLKASKQALGEPTGDVIATPSIFRYSLCSNYINY